MNVILFGSYLSYGVLLFFAPLRRRFWIYALLFLLSLSAPMYTAFLGGIVAADLLAHRVPALRGRRNGNLLALSGLIIGNFPPVLLPFGLTELTLYGVGAFLLFLGCARSARLRHWLSHPWLVRAGQLSFAMVLMHFAILMSFSAWFFLALHNKGMSYAPALALTLLTAIPVNAVFAILFERYIERPTTRLVQWVYRFLA